MSHLTYDERMEIQNMLNNNQSIKSIARKLGRPTSTISREIKHRLSVIPRKTANTCKNAIGCIHMHVCSEQCQRKCKDCARCIKHCPDYESDTCELLLNPPYVCNGCTQQRCKRERKYYKALVAENTYKTVLHDCRSGFSISDEQLLAIDTIVSPLIKQGLSPYHVAQTIKHDVPVSESTIYRLVNSTKMDARNIDLINKVKRKQRHYNYRKMKKELDCRMKDEHRYEDFLTFQKIHDYPVVELDCVEGSKDDNAVLMTLHFVNCHMQLAFILNEHSSEAVINCLDMIEETLGTDLFMQMFPLILTDNGHEFLKREEMERSFLVPGLNRTIIFYCEPNRSDEKGHCEKNHTHIRYVIPKGTSLEPFTQSDISLMMNHINSYYRKSLFGQTPYAVAKNMFPEDFFIFLGLEEIPPEEVILKPSLLNHSK